VTYDLRARPLLVLLLLVVAAATVALFMVERSKKSSDSHGSPAPAAATAHKAKAAPHLKAKAKPAPKVPTVQDRLPAAIRTALAARNVVVVSVYDPSAKTEGTAMREAQAGAEQAGSSFVRVDVRKDDLVSLNTLYGVQQDPAVLVLRPSGSLETRIDGFADRETVAQAAVNASS
jgi:hypothetical protein